MPQERRSNSRVALKDLQDLGHELGIIDATWIDIFAKRGQVSLDVGAIKDEQGNDKIRPMIEEDRLNKVATLAQMRGFDHNLARGILWQLIADSCRLQIQQTERTAKLSPKDRDWRGADPKEWRGKLKQNLIELTNIVAEQYEKNYGPDAPCAVRITREHELALVTTEANNLNAKGLANVALDLGCANGSMSRVLAKHFSVVHGCDLSGEMIRVASEHPDHKDTINYHQIDFEDAGLPKDLEDHSVNFVVMNLGTASDIDQMKLLLSRLSWKMHPRGRFFFSFYNESAWVHNWFLPWVLPLRANIDVARKELEVDINVQPDGEDPYYKRFSIFARPYNHSSARNLLAKAGFKPVMMKTFPTIASILPESIMGNQEDVFRSVMSVDHTLESEKYGAYLATVGSVDKR